MTCYMSGRFQAVWIDHCFSSYLPCEVGVPQGSILGPLIFLLFINDLSFLIKSDTEQYADDTTVSESDKSIQTLAANLTESCETISTWMSQNQFKLNPDKTYILMLGTQRRLRNNEDTLDVYMDGIKLKESESNSQTLLGCQIQDNLKWTQHICILKTKLKKRLAGVYNLRGVLPQNTLKKISEGWFQSVLVYCLPLFGGCDDHELNDLQIIQNKIARIVTQSHPRRNRIEMFEEIMWFTVRQLIAYHTLCTIFRIRNTGEPEQLASILRRENRNKNIITPTSNLALYRKSFVYRGVCLWNRIPETIKTSEKLGLFKKEAKNGFSLM